MERYTVKNNQGIHEEFTAKDINSLRRRLIELYGRTQPVVEIYKNGKHVGDLSFLSWDGIFWYTRKGNIINTKKRVNLDGKIVSDTSKKAGDQFDYLRRY